MMPGFVAQLIRASADGGVAVGVVAIASWLLARRAPALRCRLWWIACCKLLVAMAGVAPLTLPILPAAATRLAAGLNAQAAAFHSLAASPSVPESPSWPSVVVALWAAGVLFGVCVVARRYVRLRRILARSRPVGDPAVHHLLARLSDAMGLADPPYVRVSAEVSTPQVVGVFSSTILLPSSTIRPLSEDDLAMALCHELVHVRRRDLGFGWVPALASRLFFFHPGAVLAAYEYALAREEACDAEVLRVLAVSPARYGRLLVAMNVPAGRTLAPAIGVSSTFLNLRRRLRMLEHAAVRNDKAPVRWAVVALLAAAILIPVRLAARAPQGGNATASSSEDAYVLFLDANSVTMSGSLDDLAVARALRDKKGEQLLWFRQGGKEFVVTDPAVLNSVVAAHRVERERAAEIRQSHVDAQQAEIEARLEALSHRHDELGDRRAQEELRAAERLAEQSARQRQQAEMDAEIAHVSSRIGSVNTQQEEIAREIQRVAMEADRRIRELLEESVKSGAARKVGAEGGVEGSIDL